MRLGVLGSTRGSSLQPVLDSMRCGELGAEIVVVMSNKMDAGILARAISHPLPAVYCEGTDRIVLEARIQSCLEQYQIDVILLIGWMRILSSAFVEKWKDRIINVHPSLLPDFAGLMNDAVHQAVLESGVTESGCSVHRVTDIVDGGEVVVQKRCAVLPTDTVDSLKRRVQALEGPALIEAIKLLKEQLK